MCVELSCEFEEPRRNAKLVRWFHGVRKASSGWEDDRSRKLTVDGFRRGREAPTIFFHPETQVRVVAHGDDFTFTRNDSELRNIKSKMCKWYDVKVLGILGSRRRDVQEI